jgi:hypothetical protein
MMTCRIEIENNNLEVLHQIENFISTLKDVKLLKQDDDNINENHCIETLQRIENNQLDRFEPIDDIDKHIQDLKNAIS